VSISEVLAEAVAELEKVDIPTDLRSVAFAKILDLRFGDLQAAPGHEGTRAPMPPAGSSRLSTIAVKLGLDADVLADVYHEEGDLLGLGVGPTKLDPTAARATKQIALLVAAGRQAGEYDEGWTPLVVIRELCRDYNRLDTANFAATILGMSKVFTFKGKASNREVHVTRPGWDDAKALIQRLTGTES
jgi:hypothetical protein